MLLSIIIPTRNRAKYLENTLVSISKQTFHQAEFEVLVVDNGSTDNTKEVTNSFRNSIKNLEYFYKDTPGLHVGRHEGLKNSKSEILVYADDDIEAFPTWLEGIYESFENDDTVLVGGKNLPKFESEPPGWIKKMWSKKIEHGNTLGHLSILDFGDEIKEINPSFVYGCNFSIRKEILEEAGGFHPDGMPQELIKYRGDGESHVSRYISEKGYKAVYNPKASVYHLVTNSRMTLKYFEQRAYNQGISDSYNIVRYSEKKEIYNYSFSKKVEMQKKVRILKSIPFTMYFIFNFLKDPEFMMITYKINKARKKGFRYHQMEVQKDIKLFEWVMKDTYIDNIN